MSHFSLFTTKYNINVSFISPTPTLFYRPRFKGCIQRNPDDLPTISTSIIYPLNPAPEPLYLSCINTFDVWFGIPFKEANCFTHVRSHHPSEILTLYGLSALIPLYPCTISVLQIRTLVLHTFPFRVSNHITNNFLSKIIPPAISPPTGCFQGCC